MCTTITLIKMDAKFADVCHYGKLYVPAYTHYGTDKVSVQCDRCCRKNLSECFGYDVTDLCVSCKNTVCASLETKTIEKPELVTFMMQGLFTSSEDSSDENGPRIETKMMQSMFTEMTMSRKGNKPMLRRTKK